MYLQNSTYLHLRMLSRVFRDHLALTKRDIDIHTANLSSITQSVVLSRYFMLSFPTPHLLLNQVEMLRELE